MPARADDLLAVVNDLRRRVDTLERLGASRWGVDPKLLAFQLGVAGGTTVPAAGGTPLVIYTLGPAAFRAGRLYEIRVSYRAYDTGEPYFRLLKDGGFATDFYGPATAINYVGADFAWVIDGTTNAGGHTWTVDVLSKNASVGHIYTNGDYAYIKDLGPA